MVRYISTDEYIAKASKAFLQDYYASNEGGSVNILQPTQNVTDLTELFSDYTFNSQIRMLVGSIFKNNFQIVKRDKKWSRDKEKEKVFETEWRATRKLRDLATMLILYRNAYLEIEYKGKEKEVVNIHNLPSEEMYIRSNNHGKIQGYAQMPTSALFSQNNPGFKTKAIQPFRVDQVSHFYSTKIKYNPYGYVDTKAIKNIVQAKQFVENHLQELFKNNKFRLFWNIKNSASETQVKNFIESIQKGKLYPSKEIVTEGDITKEQILAYQEIQYITQLINEYRASIREFLLIPPLLGGEVGSSNKSSAEFQIRYAFDTVVKDWQGIIEEVINNDLFKKLGWEDSMLVFKPIDKPSEEKYIQQAALLKDLGYTKETIHLYLMQKGVGLPEDSTIEDPEPILQPPNTKPNGKVEQTVQNKIAPSRQDTGKSVEDTIVAKATRHRFDSYPYIIE